MEAGRNGSSLEMLILARRKGQRIRIGGDIEVVVTELSRGEVRLGIVAPKDVLVLREEVRKAVAEENRKAAESPVDSSVGDQPTTVVADLASVKSFCSSPGPRTRS
ncbi:MAG TPA: carbon storage regulator [Polyangiaceae bacterium]